MLLVLLACATGGKDSATGTDSDTYTTPTTPATLTEVQTTIFDLSCAFSSCHGQGGYAGGLSLDAGESYGNLVNMPSTGTGEILVVPGDPDASYLIKKLEDAPGIAGDEMPPGQPLATAKIERVRSWIADGAQDN